MKEIMSSEKIVFESPAWESLIHACEAGYPKEVCGILLGTEGSNRVKQIETLTNILVEQNKDNLDRIFGTKDIALPKERLDRGGAFEFLIDPKEHQRTLNLAQIIHGLDQIGIFHSHPDHPPEPSETDIAQPMLAGWSNVIVSVHERKFKKAKSWFRETENAPFHEQEILVQ